MKILQIIQMPQLRGAEVFACQLSNHLVDLGHEVMVVALFKGEASLPFLGEIINLNRSEIHRMWDITGWRKLNNLINNFKPDIIQANAGDTLKYAVSAKIIGGYHTPIILRNASKAGDYIDSLWKKELNKFYVSKVSLVISVSDDCKKDFIETYGYPEEKVRTINIGVENIDIDPPPADLKEVFTKEIILTHVGGFVPEKNHIGLIRIFSLIHEKFPQAQLILIGTGPLTEEIKSIVQNSGLNDNVHFLGSRDDILEILKESSIFVLPSLTEGLPAVLLEAMYCKIPVVAYNVGGISEIVTDGTGVIVNKIDEIKFSHAVMELINNPKGSKIDKAHEMVRENFMNDKIAFQFNAAYQESLLKQ